MPETLEVQTTPTFPPWLVGPSQDLLGKVWGDAFHGPNAQWNDDFGNMVAPFSPDQMGGMRGIRDMLGPALGLGMGSARSLLGIMGGQRDTPFGADQGYWQGNQMYGGNQPWTGNQLFGGNEQWGSGGPWQDRGLMPQGVRQWDPNQANINPGTGPAFDAASDAMVKQYRNAVAPSQMGNAILSGGAGGSGDIWQRAQNEYGLGENLQNMSRLMFQDAMEKDRMSFEDQQRREYGAGQGERERDIRAYMSSQGLDLQGQTAFMDRAIRDFGMSREQARLAWDSEMQRGLQGFEGFQQRGLQGFEGGANRQTDLFNRQGNLALQAALGGPGVQAGLYNPYHQLLGTGAQQQSQLQSGLDAFTANKRMEAEYPFKMEGQVQAFLAPLLAAFSGTNQSMPNLQQLGGDF